MGKSQKTDPWAEVERETPIDEATTETFERLHTLVQKGYRPDFDGQSTGAIYLEHPSKNFAHTRVLLYPTGLVVSLADPDNCRFYRDDKLKFQQFVSGVPRPTWMDRTRAFRTDLMAWIIIAAFFGAIWLIVDVVLRFLEFHR